MNLSCYKATDIERRSRCDVQFCFFFHPLGLYFTFFAAAAVCIHVEYREDKRKIKGVDDGCMDG